MGERVEFERMGIPAYENGGNLILPSSNGGHMQQRVDGQVFDDEGYEGEYDDEEMGGGIGGGIGAYNQGQYPGQYPGQAPSQSMSPAQTGIVAGLMRTVTSNPSALGNMLSLDENQADNAKALISSLGAGAGVKYAGKFVSNPIAGGVGGFLAALAADKLLNNK